MSATNPVIDLEDFLPTPEFVTLMSKSGPKDLPVYGIDVVDIARLLYVYKDLFMQFMDGNNVDFQRLAMVAPEAVLDILQIGLGLPAVDRPKIKKIPASVQLEILEKVYKQTVPDPKKFKELLMRTLRGLQQSNQSQPSSSITESPENQSQKNPSNTSTEK